MGHREPAPIPPCLRDVAGPEARPERAGFPRLVGFQEEAPQGKPRREQARPTRPKAASRATGSDLSELLRIAEARFGIKSLPQVRKSAEQADERTLATWLRRVHYFPAWSDVVSGEPLRGVKAVSMGEVVEHAVRGGLRKWSLHGFPFNRTGNELRDTEIILGEANWLQDCPDCKRVVLNDLLEFGTTLVVCPTEKVARALVAYHKTRAKRLGFGLIEPANKRRGILARCAVLRSEARR